LRKTNIINHLKNQKETQITVPADGCMNQNLYSAVGPSVADEFCSFVHKGFSRKRHYMGLKMTVILRLCWRMCRL